MKTSDYAAWLYGSHARSDYDNCSDIDILIIGKPDINMILEQTGFDQNQISLSQYNWDEIKKMASYGSLFLRHIMTEGKLLAATEEGKIQCEVIFGSLVPYKHMERDLKAFKKCVEDVESAIEKGSTPSFEMSVLATVLRHSAVLGSYIIGNPKFGRVEPFQVLAKRWNFQNDILEQFKDLYQFRLYEDGRTSLPFKATWRDVDVWVDRSNRFLNCLTEEIDAYQKRMSGIN